jgi:hypothetical protein
MIEHMRNDDEADMPLRIETAAMERGGHRRRVLYDESVARRAYGDEAAARAGLLRSPLEWAAAAVQWMTGTAQRRPDDAAGEVEIR